jgi:DNA-binding CsgD family transcriptional regulator
MGGVISVTVTKSKNVTTRADGSERPNRGTEGSSQDSPFDMTESIVEKRAGPGILILSTSNQLLYKDRRAWEMCADINKSAGRSASGVLPTTIVELCGEINKLLQVWTDAKDWEQIRIKRVIGSPDRPLLLSGLGLPDRHGLQSRILITMEEIGRRQGAILDQVKDLFRLTDREVTVVENLLKGWTNKEIANELGVTEQTVKEHIKHIMAKTKTTTRTGILVQVLRL